mmetsp:Transcript_13562/g.33332  ORF Transcript_13562/g.33332 Transcript_13562/m.33332 type:complete len:461 (+) Transcript_13562:106-1488(+)
MSSSLDELTIPQFDGSLVFLAKAATVASCVVTFTPLPYVYQIVVTDGDSIAEMTRTARGKMNFCLPYVCLYMSAMFWGFYGYTTDNTDIVFVNALGVFCFLGYLGVSTWYIEKNRAKQKMLLAAARAQKLAENAGAPSTPVADPVEMSSAEHAAPEQVMSSAAQQLHADGNFSPGGRPPPSQDTTNAGANEMLKLNGNGTTTAAHAVNSKKMSANTCPYAQQRGSFAGDPLFRYSNLDSIFVWKSSSKDSVSSTASGDCGRGVGLLSSSSASLLTATTAAGATSSSAGSSSSTSLGSCSSASSSSSSSSSSDTTVWSFFFLPPLMSFWPLFSFLAVDFGSFLVFLVTAGDSAAKASSISISSSNFSFCFPGLLAPPFFPGLFAKLFSSVPTPPAVSSSISSSLSSFAISNGNFPASSGYSPSSSATNFIPASRPYFHIFGRFCGSPRPGRNMPITGRTPV